MKIKRMTYKQSRKIDGKWHAFTVEAELSARENRDKAADKCREIVETQLQRIADRNNQPRADFWHDEPEESKAGGNAPIVPPW